MSPVPPSGRPGVRRRPWVVPAALGVALAAALVGAQFVPPGAADGVETWVRAHPGAGSLAYLATTALAAVLFVPGALVGTVAGYLWGLPAGLALAAAGAGLGAVTGFATTRTLGRSRVFAGLARHPRLAALDRALAERSFSIVLLTRLSVVMPYSLLNYLYGLTGVRMGPYALASLLGLVPNMALWVYLGTLARDVDALLAGDLSAAPHRPAILVAGLVALAAAIGLLHRSAARALDARIGE